MLYFCYLLLLGGLARVSKDLEVSEVQVFFKICECQLVFVRVCEWERVGGRRVQVLGELEGGFGVWNFVDVDLVFYLSFDECEKYYFKLNKFLEIMFILNSGKY